MIDCEAVLNERLQGKSVRAIARQFGRTTDEIHAILDAAGEVITPEYKIRAISVDLQRLDAMQATFYQKALSGDVGAATLCLKIAERRAALLGLDSPSRVDVVQLRAAAAPRVSATDTILRVLEEFKAKPDEDAPPH